MNSQTDTIAAIATGAGEAGISIVRMSGTESLRIADRVFRGRRVPSAVPGGSFLHGYIHAPGSDSGPDLDEVIALVYRAPHSYTREDVVEFQGHGGRVAARRVLRATLDAGARLADPGEFTKRAFLNGRLDLVQAEAVADIIAAQSDRAAGAAMEQLGGSISDLIAECYDGLIAVAADLEATLDFADGELPESTIVGIEERLESAMGDLTALLETWDEGHLLREGALVVIAGQPNVGKSTLLNALLGKDRAIVTEIAGTTRDTIEEQLTVEGIPVRLVDTAGLRETECRVEREGIQRAEDVVGKADMVLYMVDGSKPRNDDDASRLERIGPDRTLLVLNKSDLGETVHPSAFPGYESIRCSLIECRGLDLVSGAMARRLATRVTGPAHATISERHRRLLSGVLEKAQHVAEMLQGSREDLQPVAASTLREAIEELGLVTGRSYYNELLDNVFRRFCIGK